MSSVLDFDRTLTDLDHVRLKSLIRRDLRERLPSSRTQQIEDTLDACAVVPARHVSPDVVTMHSQVLLLDRASGERNRVTLCYPADAEPAEGFISVLSPLGWSLLGLRAGQVARWSTPTGGERSAEVLAILFQPEASGDFSI
jgi:regulator of nucleoside diphosphate kinase